MEFKHAVVTGAASGMGAVEVRNLRARGVAVTALDLSPELKGAYAGDPGVVCEVGDVTDLAWCRSVLAAAETRQPVDLLFHAAGIMPGGDVADMGAERINRLMEINYGGTVNAVDAVLPAMLARGSGQIVLFGSTAGIVPSRKFAAYGASKAAINYYAEVLAHEAAPQGVSVLLVTPGAIRTPLLQQASDGPKAITAMSPRLAKILIGDPERTVAAIERAMRRRKKLVRPNGTAVAALRRTSPRLTWALTEAMEKRS
ncbi:SDR family NAD(P)-dependent oxidoreductase [Nocardioides marmoriginsengisoli]|uniref:SDR family NAD(P)-dependent oxidoreductase n=1 Tax=Nocardioides marmoriginsengisoli TaxID=661483 RepID=A0A3N0CH86_9ACTN|nr:SDR family NAD(P)-dependent oxidoreductase [Nocardioides marmoriginsengisoli]RNL62373.1 SDR family NAD(P)-dependent oxidoreductase [Nocardioides marmoriginsengisoli]